LACKLCGFNNNNKKQKKSEATTRLVDEKPEEWKKLENLVSNQSIGSIIGARHTAAPRNGRRDNVGGIMTI